jgi:DedD protein
MPTLEQDTEITLGTGRMLALFFGLALICAVFFAIGFSLGKKSTPFGSAILPTATKETPAAPGRPSAAKNTQTPAEDLSFYKTVGQKDGDTGLTAQNSQPQPAASAAASPKADTGAAPPGPASGAYYVQVAAVSRQEDADALVEALKKKQYPAFTGSNNPGDKLYHVQVGPYPDIKEAEAMRAHLVSDGYNPIVKK